MILSQYYSQIMEWRDEVEEIYTITHSSGYETVINALETVSPALNAIADAISWIPGLKNYALSIRQIGDAASTMKQVRDASEMAHQAMPVVQAMPQFLTYGIYLGIFLFVVGIILVVRARRKAQPTTPPPTPVRQIETRVLAICPQCNSRISADSSFCSRCGADLRPT